MSETSRCSVGRFPSACAAVPILDYAIRRVAVAEPATDAGALVDFHVVCVV